MKRETKVGLLVGMGVILLIGIILSDQLSVVKQQDPARRMKDFGPSADREITGDGLVADPGSPAAADPNSAPMPQPASHVVTVPEPGETVPAPAHANPPTPAPDANGVKVAAGGNGSAVTPPPQQPAPEQVVEKPSNPGKPYIVKHGDTLYKIAMSAYGNGSKWDLIQKANPDVGPKGQLHEGQKLVIPADGIPQEIKDTGMFEKPGNPAGTPGVSDVPTKSDTAGFGGYKIVQVEEGDTLATIAKEQLGSAQRWKEILDVNKNQLKRPQDLQVGMKLRIPAAAPAKADASDADATTVDPAVAPGTTGRTTTASKTATAKPVPPVTPTASAKPVTYTVQPGDSLASIAAKKLGSRARWQELFQANRKQLASPADLKIGQVLILPATPGR